MRWASAATINCRSGGRSENAVEGDFSSTSGQIASSLGRAVMGLRCSIADQRIADGQIHQRRPEFGRLLSARTHFAVTTLSSEPLTWTLTVQFSLPGRGPSSMTG